MSTMVAMEGLWQYLRTLPRSNKQWLSERLQEDLHPKAATTDDDEKYISKEEVLAGIGRGACRHRCWVEGLESWQDCLV